MKCLLLIVFALASDEKKIVIEKDAESGNQNKVERLIVMNIENLNLDVLRIIGAYLGPKDLFEMIRTCKKFTNVLNCGIYINLAPTCDPIAIFQKVEDKRFFLEDPHENLTNELTYWAAGRGLNFETTNWGELFEFSMEIVDDEIDNFMLALMEISARKCPLDAKLDCHFWENKREHAGLTYYACSPLILATRCRKVRIVFILLHRIMVCDRSIINGKDSEGHTALWYAVEQLDVKMCVHLVHSGADVYDINDRGMTVMEVCDEFLNGYFEEYKDCTGETFRWGDNDYRISLLQFMRSLQSIKQFIYVYEKEKSRLTELMYFKKNLMGDFDDILFRNINLFPNFYGKKLNQE